MSRRRKLTPRDRGSEGPSRAMKVHVRITRKPTTAGQYTRKYAFEACVRMSRAGACGWGKNPRQALANAMQSVSKNLRKRRGSFKGRR